MENLWFTCLKYSNIFTKNLFRYIVCDGLIEDGRALIRDHMTSVNNTLQKLVDSNEKLLDVNEVVPADIIQSDRDFMHFIVNHNERFDMIWN